MAARSQRTMGAHADERNGHVQMIGRLLALVSIPQYRKKALTFTWTLAPTVAALTVQLAAFALTARGLGVEAFGVYTALLAVSIISVELTGWGGADILVRATAREPGLFQKYFGNMLLLIAITLPLSIAGSVIIGVYFIETPLPLLSVVMLFIAEIGIGRVAASIELVMVAHHHTVRAAAIRFTTAFMRLIAAAVYFALMKQSDVDGWILATLVQALLTIVGFIATGCVLYGRPRFQFVHSEFRDGAAFCINQASRASQGNLDRVVLGRFADAASVGIYGAATRMLALGLFPLQVVTRMTYANFFVFGKDGIGASRAYAIKILPVMLGVGIAASIAVSLAGNLAPWVLGRDFAQMGTVSALLSLSLPLIALQYPAADALTGAGFQGLRATLSMISTFGFGFAMAAGAWFSGINGLIAAYLLSHAAFAAALWIAAFRKS